MTDNEYRRLILSTRAALILPALWSVVTGGLAGAFTALMLMAIGMDNPQTGGLLVGSGASLITWFTAMIWWLRQWRRVRAPHVAPPVVQLPKAVVRFEHYEQGGRVIKIDELSHTPPDQLRKIARRVANGEDVTTTFLLSIFNGNRPNMEECRNELIKQGFFVWNSELSHNQGMSVTDKGREQLTPFATGARDSGGSSRRSRKITQGDDDA